MYYTHFGLKQAPFKITPNTEFFFSGGNRGAVLDALIYAVTTGEGIVKVVGEVGSGKTMLCRMLQTLLPAQVESVYLANPSLAPEDILHAIAFELGLDLPRNADRLLVMQALQQHLLARHAENRRVVIFIEEAQGMPLGTLEEIRLLTNLETRHDKLLQIVLFGQPELDRNLDAPEIRQLRERITHNFPLGPLRRQDIGDYLMFRLRTAGYVGPPLFSKGAMRLLARASTGLVRRINILADKAMLAAFADNAYAITSQHMRTAIRDSEFSSEVTRRGWGWRGYLAGVLLVLLGCGAGLGLSAWLRARSVEKTPVLPATAVAAVASTPPPAAAPPVTLQPASAVTTPPQVPPAPADILQQRLQATQSWLQQQPAVTLTIQLLGTVDAEQLRRQLKLMSGQLELQRLYVYQSELQGRPYYTVLYGSFSGREAAVREMLALPGPLQAYRPHLRTVGGITRETAQVQ